MKTRKIGLMMGAGLLLTGTGVATAITTTSCSNDKKSGLSFVNGTMEAISQSIDDADQKNGYRLAATITGFDDTKWDNIFFLTTKDGSSPKVDAQNLWWTEPDQITNDSPNGLMATTRTDASRVTKIDTSGSYLLKAAETNPTTVTVDNVWSIFVKKDSVRIGYCSDFYKEGSLTFEVNK